MAAATPLSAPSEDPAGRSRSGYAARDAGAAHDAGTTARTRDARAPGAATPV
ncbi:MAG: hypothetical protein QOJ43_2752, partial [Gaiellaceae bacterium]|nr:hypothetical protein [Gaiellaceae bacterium]